MTSPVPELVQLDHPAPDPVGQSTDTSVAPRVSRAIWFMYGCAALLSAVRAAMVLMERSPSTTAVITVPRTTRLIAVATIISMSEKPSSAATF